MYSCITHIHYVLGNVCLVYLYHIQYSFHLFSMVLSAARYVKILFIVKCIWLGRLEIGCDSDQKHFQLI